MGLVKSVFTFGMMLFAVLAHGQNSKPKFIGANTMTMSVEQAKAFYLMVSDDDADDTVKIYLISAQINGLFETNNGLVKKASGQYTISAKASDASQTPYEINFIAVDNASTPDTAYFTVYVTIVGLPGIHAINRADLGCGFWTFSIDPNAWATDCSFDITNSATSSTAYSGVGFFDTVQLEAGIYRVNYSLMGDLNIIRRYVDTIEIHEGIMPRIFGPSMVCVQSNVGFRVEYNSKEKIVSRDWLLDDGQLLETLDINTDTLLTHINRSGYLRFTIKTEQCMYESAKEIEAEPCLSVDALSKNSFQLYPNPARAELVLEMAEEAHILIISSLGQVYRTFEASEGLNNLNIADFENGIYWVMIQTKGGQQRQTKLIKIN